MFLHNHVFPLEIHRTGCHCIKNKGVWYSHHSDLLPPPRDPVVDDDSARQRRRYRSRSTPPDFDGRGTPDVENTHRGRRSVLHRLGPTSETAPKDEGVSAGDLPGDAWVTSSVMTVLGSELPQGNSVPVEELVPVELYGSVSDTTNVALNSSSLDLDGVLEAVTVAPEAVLLQDVVVPVEEVGPVEPLGPVGDAPLYAINSASSSPVLVVDSTNVALNSSGLVLDGVLETVTVTPEAMLIQDVVVPVEEVVPVEPHGPVDDAPLFAIASASSSPVLVLPTQNLFDQRWRPDRCCLNVYSRRTKVGSDPSILKELVDSLPLETFKQIITKPINGLLSPPRCNLRKKKTLPKDFMPRRSRRVAKLPPVLGNVSVAKVCRHLGYYGDHEEISLENAASYAKLFEDGLSKSHVEAMAALFGWEVLVEIQVSA
jgi:hypothetical protein